MTPAEARDCDLDPAAATLLADLYSRRRLSGRAHDRALRLARTVADLAGVDADRRGGDGAGAAAAEEGSCLSSRACVECLRRSWLLALLGPYLEKVATGSVGRRSPELLRLSNEDLVEVVAPNDGEGADRAGRGARGGLVRREARPRPGAGRSAATTSATRPACATPPTRPGR